MSPLMVSQVLPAARLFDVVIFDEASQIVPADAIPSIMRGHQIVVAGDDRQLPPTNFFRQFGDAGDEDEKTTRTSSRSGPASSRCSTRFARCCRPRRWPGTTAAGTSGWWPSPTAHLRRRADHVPRRAAGRLPEPRRRRAGRRARPGGVGQRRGHQVVELVLEHARTRPDESLGVIALGIKHAERIDLALREALATAGPRPEAFFADDVPEPFFVKNLERVQGDERDAIILSIGYGKHPDGRMRYQWGPLLRDGGERRLNVAATRAKHRLTAGQLVLQPRRRPRAGDQGGRAAAGRVPGVRGRRRDPDGRGRAPGPPMRSRPASASASPGTASSSSRSTASAATASTSPPHTPTTPPG